MKHIVIPTDFSIASLQPIHTVIEHFDGEPVSISLLHLLHMPTGIMDLLTRPVDAIAPHVINADFRNACQVLRNKYTSRIQQMDIVLKYGSTSAFMNNLLDAMQVDALYVSEPFSFALPCKQSVNLSKLLKSARHKTVKVPTTSFVSKSVGDSLAGLLVNTDFDTVEPTILKYPVYAVKE